MVYGRVSKGNDAMRKSMTFAALAAAALLMQGCVATVVGATAGAAIGVAGAAVGATAKGVGAVGRAIIPGDSRKDKN
jgi:hypothetical protein